MTTELEMSVSDLEAMEEFASRLAAQLRAGDLVILSGDLGAGKTTLTQFIAAGLDVRGHVSSPTFIIAREHAPRGVGPGLVHVDAYRLSDAAELDDLGLDADLDDVVTIVEWGRGMAEQLASDRLEIDIASPAGDIDGEERSLQLRAVGESWTERLSELEAP